MKIEIYLSFGFLKLCYFNYTNYNIKKDLEASILTFVLEIELQLDV